MNKYEIRTNNEIKEIFENENFNSDTLGRRMNWLGYVWKSIMIKKILKCNQKPLTKPNKIWLDPLNYDLRIVDTQDR